MHGLISTNLPALLDLDPREEVDSIARYSRYVSAGRAVSSNIRNIRAGRAVTYCSNIRAGRAETYCYC